MSGDTCVLVTGATGFVGRHLVAELERRLAGRGQVVPTGFDAALPAGDGTALVLDVTDEAAVDEAVRRIQPTHLIHLSGIAEPSEAGANRRRAWDINTFGTMNVAEAVLRRAPGCSFIFAGSGLVYGAAREAGRRFAETSPIAPLSDYAVTKAAAELLLGAMGARGLRSVRLRLFNHTGAGQSEAFVIPRLAAQIARIEAGLQPPVLKLGNLESVRDFLDVRDVVAAYALAVEHAVELPSAIVLNIASGRGHRIGEIVENMLALTSVAPTVESAGGGPGAMPDALVGDPALAQRLLGWKPRYGLQQTLQSVLGYWRREISESPATKRSL
jgi:GDP-4-dehydro-6-deoxy-D-mannose reductase